MATIEFEFPKFKNGESVTHLFVVYSEENLKVLLDNGYTLENNDRKGYWLGFFAVGGDTHTVRRYNLARSDIQYTKFIHDVTDQVEALRQKSLVELTYKSLNL